MYQYQSINPIWLGWVPPLPALTPLGCPQQSIVSDNDTINIGSGNQNVTGNPSPVTVTDVTTITYTALATDYFLCVDTSVNTTTITLPVGILGTVYIIKDCTGDATTNPITIQGSGGQLVDGSTATINAPFGSITVIFNGSGWSIV